MAFNKETLDRWYQGLNQTYVNLKKHFDTLNKGGPLPAVQLEITNLGRTIDALGTMIKQFQTQIQATPDTTYPTPGAATVTTLAAAPPSRAASLGELIHFADYLDTNGYHELTNKVVSVLELSAQVGRYNLVKLADYLDNNEFYTLANKVDEVNDLLYMAKDYGFIPKYRTDVVENAADDELIQIRSKGSLSTRYCPDHHGVQAIRIAENTYQCPIDGKKYNYEAGYVNYEGQKVPGGSIAAQTPTTSDFGGIPMRIYDSRSDVLNRMN
ncbi:MAG: hypothetical protein WC516_05520 [Patescibacteria group bacterium]